MGVDQLVTGGDFDDPVVDSLTSDSVNTEDGFNTEIEDNIDYLDPRWLVLSDAIWWQENALSVDNIGFVTSGSGSQGTTGDGDIVLKTGDTSGSYIRGFDELSQNDADAMTWDNDRYVEFYVNFQDTEGPLYITTGTVLESDKSFNHVGFAMVGGDLVGTVGDGSSETTATIAAGATTGSYRLRAEFISGTEANFEVVAGPSSGTAAISSGLPNGTSLANRTIHMMVQNSTATDRRMDINGWKGVQAP